MQKKNSPRPRSRTAATAVAREFSWSYLMLIIACGCVLAAGFFFAARQHFLTMDYGFKNSKLKKQLEDLESENRRLLLAKETSLSPFELRKVSRTLVASGKRTQSDGRIEKVSALKDGSERNSSKPAVTKIADGQAAKPASKQPSSKTLASVESTGVEGTHERKIGVELTAMAKLR